MSQDQTVEQEIQAKGLTAPRLTPKSIEETIIGEMYYQPSGRDRVQSKSQDTIPVINESLGCLTICILVLANGFSIVGKSACASPQNFDAPLGRRIAREDAVRQVWALEGYALRNKLSG